MIVDGATCTIDAPATRFFHGKHCTARFFDREKKQWLIRLQDGREMFASESLLRLAKQRAGVHPTFEVFVDSRDSAGDWCHAASHALGALGACALRPLAGSPSPISSVTIERCLRDARPRLDHMLGVAAKDKSGQGVASNGAVRFKELYSRAPHEHRFDVTVIREGEFLGGGGDEGAWRALLAQVDAVVQPVLCGTPSFAAVGAAVESVGFILSFPGAPSQQWHPDDSHTAGLVTVFVPLIDLTRLNGPTELALGTHIEPACRLAEHMLCTASTCDQGGHSELPGRERLDVMASLTAHTWCAGIVQPALSAGSLLLFDWRTWHRGGANQSEYDRPVACVTYYARGARPPHYYKAGLASLSEAAGRVAAQEAAAVATETAATVAAVVVGTGGGGRRRLWLVGGDGGSRRPWRWAAVVAAVPVAVDGCGRPWR
jgi:hypothetical protein